IEAIVISTHHAASATQKEISDGVRELVINPVLKGQMVDGATKILVNPSGSFVLGGPAADAGLTGRKIIVDTYGGVARHGGGAIIAIMDLLRPIYRPTAAYGHFGRDDLGVPWEATNKVDALRADAAVAARQS